MNSKSKVFQGIVLVALSLTFIGYYFSLYRGYESNIAHYSGGRLSFSPVPAWFYLGKKANLITAS